MSAWYDLAAARQVWDPDPDATHDPEPVPYDPAMWGPALPIADPPPCEPFRGEEEAA